MYEFIASFYSSIMMLHCSFDNIVFSSNAISILFDKPDSSDLSILFSDIIFNKVNMSSLQPSKLIH